MKSFNTLATFDFWKSMYDVLYGVVPNDQDLSRGSARNEEVKASIQKLRR